MFYQPWGCFQRMLLNKPNKKTCGFYLRAVTFQNKLSNVPQAMRQQQDYDFVTWFGGYIANNAHIFIFLRGPDCTGSKN